MSRSGDARVSNESGTRSLADLADLRGRVALVTGGAGHLGSVLCDALAERGAAVCVADLDEGRTTEVAADLGRRWGRETLALPVDLAREKDVRDLPARILKPLGRLDVLVHCAALVGTSGLEGWAVKFEEQSAVTWRRALEINLTVPFVLTQACAGALRTNQCGSVITVGSIYGLVGPDMRLYEGTAMGNPAAYAASKGGLVQLTRWLATALAPAVRVNAVSLGGIRREQPSVFVSRYEERVPLGRMATEQDIKGAVAYFASDLSAYVTGHNLVIDGGWTAW